MQIKTPLIAGTMALLILSSTGCAVTRGQETMGAYMDDSAITTAVKARFVKNSEVDASAISVETLNGTVMLSGFAKDMHEKNMAEHLAKQARGVKEVKNEILVRAKMPAY
jgi:hyperosmotically inducible periplasmic protein